MDARTFAIDNAGKFALFSGYIYNSIEPIEVQIVGYDGTSVENVLVRLSTPGGHSGLDRAVLVHPVPEMTRLWYVVWHDLMLIDKSPAKTNDNFPHKCPACGYKAYIGFSTIECAGAFCMNNKIRACE